MSFACRHVVIAGGGFAALECLAALRAHAGDAVSVTLLAPERELSYRPVSVLTPFTGRAADTFALRAVAEDFAAVLLADALDAVDPDARMATTRSRGVVPYDDLVVAVGAQPRVAVRGAAMFRGGRDVAMVRRVIDDLAARRAGRVAFIVPSGRRWELPMVELALLAARSARRGRVALVTAEPAPLSAFGPTPAETVRQLLADAGVRLLTDRRHVSYDPGTLWLGLGEALACDAAIALPQLRGPAVHGLPHDNDGFLPVDGFGRVAGTDVFAAGDGTDLPFKHGGVASQVADVVARGIARRAGIDLKVEPVQVVLRGMLATPDGPLFLRRATDEPDGEVAREPLWWPPAKVAAPHLASYLALGVGRTASSGPRSVAAR